MYFKEFEDKPLLVGANITPAGIACIIMREVYATMGESIYPNPSFLSRDFPEASGRLLRNHKRVHVSRYGQLIGT